MNVNINIKGKYIDLMEKALNAYSDEHIIHYFERVKEETEHQKELYRRKKAEKKLLAQKRLAEQAAKRKERENR